MTLPHAVMSFLLSLHAAGHACVALDPARLPLVGFLVAVAAAASLREQPESVDSGRVDPGHAMAWGVYAALLVSSFAFAGGGRGAGIGLALYLLLGCQVLFLAAPQLGREHLPVLVNAQALAALASLVGGPLAVSALAGHALLLVAWLAVDHRVRRGASLVGAVRAALPPALVVVGWLTIAFTLRPPRPNERILQAAATSVREVPPGEVFAAWAKLLLVAGVGLGLLLLVRRLLRSDDDAAVSALPPGVPVPPSHQREAVGRPVGEPVDLSGARGRIVRAYLRLLRRLPRLGLEPDPALTPAELARRLPAPAAALAALFGRARYSREPLRDGDASRAEREAREVLAALKRQR